MAGKLNIKCNDFKDNICATFGSLREDKDFADVTLACEDGQQVEAHKVILAGSSPFFQKLLKRNHHPHPLIFMRNVSSENLEAIVDFLYFGEANVLEQTLESFLAVAEELKVKGLTQNGPSSPGRREPAPAPKRQIVTDPVPPPPPKRPRPPPPVAAPEVEEIQEVASVKAEPREPQYQPQEQEQVDHHQSLAQVDEYGGEEGYEEDYGQYEEGYAMMASAGAEGNKGKPPPPHSTFCLYDSARIACKGPALDIWCHKSSFSGTYRESRGPLQIPHKARYWRFLLHSLHEVLQQQERWQEPLGGNPLP